MRIKDATLGRCRFLQQAAGAYLAYGAFGGRPRGLAALLTRKQESASYLPGGDTWACAGW